MATMNLLVTVLKAQRSDSYKAVSLKSMIESTTYDSNDIPTIIDLFNSDSYKNDAVSVMMTKINNLTVSNIIQTLNLINNEVYKTSIFGSMVNKIQSLTTSNLVSVLNKFSSDVYKSEVVTKASNRFTSLSGDDLVDILNCFNTDMYKNDIVTTLACKIQTLSPNDLTIILNTFNSNHYKKSASNTLVPKIVNNDVINSNNSKLDVLQFLNDVNNIDDNEKNRIIAQHLESFAIPIQHNEESFCQQAIEHFSSRSNYEKFCDMIGISKNVYSDPNIKKKPNYITIFDTKYDMNTIKQGITHYTDPNSNATATITRNGNQLDIQSQLRNEWGGGCSSSCSFDSDQKNIVIKSGIVCAMGNNSMNNSMNISSNVVIGNVTTTGVSYNSSFFNNQ